MPYCAFCGTQIADAATTCPKCGHPQGTPATPAAAAPVRRTEGGAIAALILGIAGIIVCPFVPSIIAVIVGSQARKKIAEDQMLEGDALAKTGVILGWVGIGLGALLAVGAVLLIVFSSTGSIDPDFSF
jgi:hypothetical protein